MADNNVSNTSKPAKAPTEKKKRKRPSKKVPTTVLQANNSGFMQLVQKLTGSAEEHAAATSSPYSSHSNQLEPMTTYQNTATPDVDTYPSYSTATAPYSNAPSYGMGSYIQEQYQPYQDPAPSNYGGSNYGYGGGYGGTGGYGSGGYGGSGSRSYAGDENENSTYGYRGGSGDPSDRYNNNNNNGSSPSSSRGVDTHEGSPNQFGNHNSSSDYYW